MKRTEIGSDFWDIPTTDTKNSIFNQHTNWYISGRAALNHIILDIKSNSNVGSVAMPSWCCDSMIEPFLKNGIDVYFYPVYINEKNILCQEIAECGCDILYIMDYFGYSQKNTLPRHNKIVIRDTTHSLFTETHCDADYVFGSLRKWAGFLTGGYAYSKKGFSFPHESAIDFEYITMRETAMLQKQKYISLQTNSKSYLSLYKEAEEHLNSHLNGSAAQHDINDALYLDVDFIRVRRRENAQVLLNCLGNVKGVLPIFSKMGDLDCPLFVPIRVLNNKRDELRKYLIEREFYCPVHWPVSSSRNLVKSTEPLYAEELSLVCDQRYNANDMNRLAEAIINFFEE